MAKRQHQSHYVRMAVIRTLGNAGYRSGVQVVFIGDIGRVTEYNARGSGVGLYFML